MVTAVQNPMMAVAWNPISIPMKVEDVRPASSDENEALGSHAHHNHRHSRGAPINGPRSSVEKALERAEEGMIAQDPAEKAAEAAEKEMPGPSQSRELSDEEQERLRWLRSRDAEVRAHEMAHRSVAGSLAGAVMYQFERGPDGMMYATGGEVPIQISAAKSPRETAERARRVQAAALAPLNPSGADYAAAAAASMLESRAMSELSTSRPEVKKSPGIGPEASINLSEQARVAATYEGVAQETDPWVNPSSKGDLLDTRV